MIRRESANLDMLRAMAVSMVFIDHTAGFFLTHPRLRHGLGWCGGLGVAFFFVHTSMVLMMSMERSGLRGRALATWFYVRRACRIYPLSCAVVLFVFFTGIPQRFLVAHVATGTSHTPIILFANLTLTQNLLRQPSVSGQLWSLPVELDMYLLLPFIFAVAVRHAKPFLWLAWPLSVIAAVLSRGSPSLAALGSVLWFAPMFIPGVLAFLLVKTCKPRFSAWLWPILILAVAGAFVALRSWPAGWVLCLVIGCSLPLFREQENKILNWVAHGVAKYSYGIYLTHLLTIWVSFAYLASWPLYWRVFVFVISSTLLPYMLFHAIERPGIDLGKWMASRDAGQQRSVAPATS